MRPGPLAYLIHWAVSALALLVTAHLVRGFKVRGFFSALLACLAIGLCNALVWPLLIFLTLPINVLTLGLFTFVVNGATLRVAAWLMPGLEIDSWSAAIFGSVVLSLVSMVLHYVLI